MNLTRFQKRFERKQREGGFLGAVLGFGLKAAGSAIGNRSAQKQADAMAAAKREAAQRNEANRMQLYDDLGTGVFPGETDYFNFTANDVFGAKPEVAFPTYATRSTQRDGAYGTPNQPHWDRFTPVDFGAIQRKTIADNITAAPQAIKLSEITNDAITAMAQDRVNAWQPGYTDTLENYHEKARRLIDGFIPFQDRVEGIAGGQTVANWAGMPGVSVNRSLRDLGLLQLEGLNMGGGMMGQLTQWDAINDPISRHMSPESMYLRPSQTVPLEMQQNIVRQEYGRDERRYAYEAGLRETLMNQEAQQNRYNVDASPDPVASNLFGIDQQGKHYENQLLAGADLSQASAPRSNPLGSFVNSLGGWFANGGAGNLFGGGIFGNGGGGSNTVPYRAGYTPGYNPAGSIEAPIS